MGLVDHALAKREVGVGEVGEGLQQDLRRHRGLEEGRVELIPVCEGGGELWRAIGGQERGGWRATGGQKERGVMESNGDKRGPLRGGRGRVLMSVLPRPAHSFSTARLASRS